MQERRVISWINKNGNNIFMENTKSINPIAERQIKAIVATLKESPIVVISCPTYNHAPYIRDTLNGFVQQKTDFPFIAIIHDDASTDGTSEIIKEYAEKYPEIIKPIYEEENQYSKKNGTLTHIINMACFQSGAKYIAFCEGDDYWTDSLKLQKQVDFLESYPEYSGCFHETDVNNTSSSQFSFPPLEDRAYTAEELFTHWLVPTASIMARNKIESMPIDSRFMNGDSVLVQYITSIGKFFGMSDKMAVYNLSDGGATMKRMRTPVTSYFKELKHTEAMYEYFPQITWKACKIRYSDIHINLGWILLKDFKLSGVLHLYLGLFYSPKNFYKRLKNLFSK